MFTNKEICNIVESGKFTLVQRLHFWLLGITQPTICPEIHGILYRVGVLGAPAPIRARVYRAVIRFWKRLRRAL